MIRYSTNGFGDVGTTGMLESAEISGEIASIPEIPGLVVCMEGHIGVYIGNGEVIEAKGNRDGVVKTQLAEGAWTRWMQVPGITYLTDGTHPYGTKKVVLENGRIKEITAGVVAGKGDFNGRSPLPTAKIGSQIPPVPAGIRIRTCMKTRMALSTLAHCDDADLCCGRWNRDYFVVG